MRLANLQDVLRWRLCVGCGACAYLSDGAIAMTDDASLGHRPSWPEGELPGMLDECLKVCPAVGTGAAHLTSTGQTLGGATAGVGPVLAVWEGHATDQQTRHLGSSGGVLTALAAYAVEQGGMHGVLHVAADRNNPLCNHTVMSHTRDELLARTGSRYAPASVCDGLKQIEDAAAPCVFIGQPSEVAALRKAQSLRPALNRNVGVVLSFFCAGSPATQGTLDLLASKGIEPSRVSQIRYRGRGWPGTFAVWLKGESEPALELTYAESWGFIQAYRPWAVQLWPDGLGELADIACGDAWCRDAPCASPGSSLVIVRTMAGQTLLNAAMAAGYLALTRSDVAKVVESQRNLMRKKGAAWGRLMSMRILGLPTPSHRGYDLFGSWIRLPIRDKLRSTVGTFRRVLTRKYHIPESMPTPRTPSDPRSPKT